MMACLPLCVLVLCCVLPCVAGLCSVLPQSDGVHVQCRDGNGSVPSFPDLPPDGAVWLDLRHNGLAELPDLDRQVARRVQHVDVSDNRLTCPALGALLRLHPQLRTLSLSANNLTSLSSGTFRGLRQLTSLDLSHNHLVTLANNLTSLSSGTFRGLRQLTSLDLSHNHLVTLANNTFTDLVSLTFLTLSDNGLFHLEPLAFVGLNRLKEIHLDTNHLLLPGAHLPPGVFAPLQSVDRFSLVHNSNDSLDVLPQAVFSDLLSVKHLSIDSLPGQHFTFGADFAKMVAIDTLDLHLYCRASRFSNDTFFGFKNSSLQTIVAVDCDLLLFVDSCAFCDLPHLQYLDLSQNSLLMPYNALLSLYGLQGQHMEEITIQRPGRVFNEYFTIDKKSTQYLRNICVHRFSMARSRLQRWTVGSVNHMKNREFARCIEHVDASKNYLRGDVLAFLLMLSEFKNLTSLQLQEQRTYSLKNAACVLSDSLNCPARGSSTRDGLLDSSLLSITVSPKLRYLNISSMSNYFNAPPKQLRFQNATSLQTLDLSYGAFSHCLTTLVGLDGLETLDLSGNYCNKISDDLLDHLPALRHLSMSSTHLTATDIRRRAHRLLRGLSRLETLDLSWNWLLHIEGDSLPRQQHLQALRLSHNGFQSLPVNIDLHPNLTDLDLSFNAITSLTSSERSSLDRMASRHPLRLGLRGNPLLCACSNMDFLQWLWATNVTLDGEGTSTRRYTCTSDTGQLTDTEQVLAEWQVLWRRCLGLQVFGWAMAAFLVQMLGLLVTYMISRSWTHLLYAWHVLRRLRLPTRHEFRRDVYIAYADADVELACFHLPRCLEGHGIRFLLRYFEEQPGSVMADNIDQFIDDSWKVLLVVTEAFAADDWQSGFTVHLAQRSISDTLPDRVLLVFMADPRRLPPMASLEKLLRHYPQRNVFHVPPDAPVTHPEWRRLATAIVGDH